MKHVKIVPTKPTAYEVLVGLSYPTDPKIIERLVGGEDIPWEDRGIKQAEVGTIVDDIPTVSVEWLLEQGIIREVTEDG